MRSTLLTTAFLCAGLFATASSGFADEPPSPEAKAMLAPVNNKLCVGQVVGVAQGAQAGGRKMAQIWVRISAAGTADVWRKDKPIDDQSALPPTPPADANRVTGPVVLRQGKPALSTPGILPSNNIMLYIDPTKITPTGFPARAWAGFPDYPFRCS
jgi:hypothetical protein